MGGGGTAAAALEGDPVPITGNPVLLGSVPLAMSETAAEGRQDEGATGTVSKYVVVMTAVRATVVNSAAVGQTPALLFRESVGVAEGSEESSELGMVTFDDGTGNPLETVGTPVPPVTKAVVEFAVTGAIAVEGIDAPLEKMPVELADGIGPEIVPVPRGVVLALTSGVGMLTEGADPRGAVGRAGDPIPLILVEFADTMGIADVPPVESGTETFAEVVGRAFTPVPEDPVGTSRETFAEAEGTIPDDGPGTVERGMLALTDSTGREPDAVPTGKLELDNSGGTTGEPVPVGRNVVELIEGVGSKLDPDSGTEELGEIVGIAVDARVVFEEGL